MFSIFGAKKSFTKLRQIFIKALILNYFGLKRHIYIGIDVSDYIMGRIFH